MAEAGWYQDPKGDGLRWFDGSAWTEHVAAAPAGVQESTVADPDRLSHLAERVEPSSTREFSSPAIEVVQDAAIDETVAVIPAAAFLHSEPAGGPDIDEIRVGRPKKMFKMWDARPDRGSSMTTYDLKAHIDELAREHLDRHHRARLRPLLDSACSILRPSETPLRLSDAYLDERFGLLVLTDERALHRAVFDESEWVSVELEDETSALATKGSASFDLVVRFAEHEHRFEAVGDRQWAVELADVVNGDSSSDPDHAPDIPTCGVCGASEVAPGRPCPSCGIALADPEPEEIVFNFDDYPPNELAIIAAAIEEAGIPHEWDGVRLGVDETNEAVVDALLDDLETSEPMDAEESLDSNGESLMTDDASTKGASDDNSGFDIDGPILRIGAGIGIFIMCSIVQAIGGSTMFEMSFDNPDNLILEMLMQVTWYPGWAVTVVLILSAVVELVSDRQ